MNYSPIIKGFEDVKLSNQTNYKISKVNDQSYIVQMDGINYNAILLESDAVNKKFKFNIEGRIVEIELNDDLDRLVDKMEFNKNDKLGSKELNAPMPGVILSIDIAIGDVVSIGDKLFTLEAMKMENIIKSSINGVVASILVEKNEAVDKGKLLLEFE